MVEQAQIRKCEARQAAGQVDDCAINQEVQRYPIQRIQPDEVGLSREGAGHVQEGSCDDPVRSPSYLYQGVGL